jgi:hypothetical protein
MAELTLNQEALAKALAFEDGDVGQFLELVSILKELTPWKALVNMGKQGFGEKRARLRIGPSLFPSSINNTVKHTFTLSSIS